MWSKTVFEQLPTYLIHSSSLSSVTFICSLFFLSQNLKDQHKNRIISGLSVSYALNHITLPWSDHQNGREFRLRQIYFAKSSLVRLGDDVIHNNTNIHHTYWQTSKVFIMLKHAFYEYKSLAASEHYPTHCWGDGTFRQLLCHLQIKFTLSIHQ